MEVRMYNLLISLGVAAAVFGGSTLLVHPWYAGVIPGLIALLITYVLMARRSGKRFQAIADRAVKEFQANRMASGTKILEQGFKLANWQFFIGPQIHGQLGMLSYMQRDWKKARVHLDQSWRRDWRARSMLAALDHRQSKKDSALKRMDKLTGLAGKDPTFWALYAYIALEAKKRELAMTVLNDGLKKCKDSPGLKGMLNSVRNKKKPKMKAFAPTWYQYFPEQMPRSAMMAHAKQGMKYPMPKR
jgi:predicted Zn-dependent protease